ncbi:RagB/SusD family nutrient uptake outer membrane protein [Agriterribacter sp.]|uniref:RagB/SusD family nutrient uptake outer membrane protein n=1 Tax=Agriterribacter sp. TaxID=2821509 RepID=UPI002B69F797|nr:RagB/SusD family nutrient uptake outer membrane protein [Agriterribacter sp.]HTN05090.1 RagB/SusD family nutrient uptake outer membrane protein [Agriterribacter sp.]
MNNMIKNISVVIFIAGVIALASCNKDFLNTKPLGEVSSEDVWKDGPLSEAFVTGVYSRLGMGGFDEQMLSSLTDESVFTHPNRGIDIVNEGILNPSNLGWTNGTYEWGSMFSGIRSASVALTNLRTATFDDQDLNDRLQGESYFLRAYYSHQLLRFYGAFPIIEKPYGLNEDYTIARNTFEECVNFIVDDCDSAILLLKGKDLPRGRASQLAAMALKSRVLLYAASDLYDVPTAKSKSTVLAAYPNPELIGYTSGDRIARWTAAKDAAKAVIDLGTGYKLGLAAPVSFADAKKNYISMAMGGGSKDANVDAAAEVEIIFERGYTADKDEYAGQYVGLANGPNGYHNWAGNTPVQQMVDDYEMMDGTKFSWSNPAQAASPYTGREPRFYATILYDGADWKPRDKISGNVDPANQVQTGQYQVGAGNIFGLDTRQSSIEDWNGSWTGYYMRKFTDPDPVVVDNYVRQSIPWPFFRYTEAVFNYIEACIELGEEPEARDWLNKIRYRAGMPAITESGAALRDRYRNERRIEMAYEEQRYFDARRWMIASSTLGRENVFISVKGTLKPGQTAPSPYRKDDTKYNYTYTPFVDVGLEDRQWLDKMYFRPLSRDEVKRNDKLIQNPGYE